MYQFGTVSFSQAQSTTSNMPTTNQTDVNEEPAVVTPNKTQASRDNLLHANEEDGEDDSSLTANKRRKTNYDVDDNIKAQSLLAAGTKAYITTLAGGLELIYFNSGYEEGFGTHYLTKILFDQPQNHREAIAQRSALEMTCIISAVPRRESLVENKPKMKSDDAGKKYKQVYFVRRTRNKNGSSVTEQKDCLDTLVQLMNTADFDAHTERRSKRAYKKLCSVADNYIQYNPKSLSRWDEMILDQDVAQLMQIIFKPIPNKYFFDDATELAKNCFTEPYCKIAETMFGYHD